MVILHLIPTKGFEQDTHSQFGDFSSFFSGFGGGHGTQPYQGSEGYTGHGIRNPLRKTLKEENCSDEPYETFLGTGGRARTRRASIRAMCHHDVAVILQLTLKIGFVESLRVYETGQDCSPKSMETRQ